MRRSPSLYDAFSQRNLFWVVLFGALTFVPLLFFASMAVLANFNAGVGRVLAGRILHALGFIFLLVFFLCGVFVQSLLLAAAFQFRREGFVSFLEVFRGLRRWFWRVLLHDALLFVISLPALLLSASGMVNDSSLLVWLSVVYAFVMGFFLLWTPAHLEILSPWRSFLASIKDARQNPWLTARILLRLVALFVIPTLLFVLASWSSIGAEQAFVTLPVLGLHLASLVLAFLWYFPVYFMQGTDYLVLEVLRVIFSIAVLSGATLWVVARRPIRVEDVTSESKGSVVEIDLASALPVDKKGDDDSEKSKKDSDKKKAKKKRKKSRKKTKKRSSKKSKGKKKSSKKKSKK